MLNAPWIAVLVLAGASGCYRSHPREGDAGTFEPCTVPLDTAEVTIGDRRVTTHGYAYAQGQQISLAAYVDGSDIYLPPDADGCALGSAWSSYRPVAEPPYDLMVRSSELPIDCADLTARQRVDLHQICERRGCARVGIIECEEDWCRELSLERGELDAFVEGGGPEPTFCAHVDATTTDGRPFRMELRASLNHCYDC
jgi:hypothetical protein